MGYTHYWYRPKKLDAALFARVTQDFKKLIAPLDRFGVSLAGGNGEGEAILTPTEICFNGPTHCGHAKNEAISIPWPAPNAGGVDTTFEGSKKHLSGHWFAGAELDARVCNGDCSYETFSLDQLFKPNSWQKPTEDGPEKGLYFDCCKTAFRPYDLAVTACLVIAKHHLGKDFIVHSDGEDQHWFDAKMLCQQELGYGLDFTLPKESLEKS